ncbi:MAG: STAS domain-containing protein [Chlamydiota bacterium]|nr:STAS domain-containing protein [Chlamydiota bacterium]
MTHPEESPLKISQKTLQSSTLLKIEGRLDATTTPQLNEVISAVMEANNQPILINCSALTYLSSAGMRLLIAATRKHKVSLFSIPSFIMEIIEMAGFTRILTIHPQQEDAEAAL